MTQKPLKCLPQGVFGQKRYQKWPKTPKKWGHFWPILAKNEALLAGKYLLKMPKTKKPRLSTTFEKMTKNCQISKVVERRGFLVTQDLREIAQILHGVFGQKWLQNEKDPRVTPIFGQKWGQKRAKMAPFYQGPSPHPHFWPKSGVFGSP